MALRPLVVIDNGVIDALMADPAVMTLFPSCFANLRPAAGGCRKCQKKDMAAYAATKECLLAAPSDARERLKTMLQTEQVRITVLRNGEPREYAY